MDIKIDLQICVFLVRETINHRNKASYPYIYSKLGTMSSCRALHIKLKTKKNPSKLLFQLAVSLPSDFKYLFLLCNEFISAVFGRLSKTNSYSLKWEFSYLIYLSAVFCPLLSKYYNICLPVQRINLELEPILTFWQHW